jgi:hypothetical protein
MFSKLVAVRICKLFEKKSFSRYETKATLQIPLDVEGLGIGHKNTIEARGT